MPLEATIIRDLARLTCRQPPACEEAEMALLGAMILDPTIVPEVATKLDSGDFWNDAHGSIYRLVLSVHNKYGTVDLVGLAETVRGVDFQDARINDMGNVGYLGKLVSETPGAAGWPYWVRQVTEAARKRRFVTAAFNAARKAMAAGPSDDTDEVLEAATQAVALAGRSATQATDIPIGKAEDDVIAQLEAGVADVLPTKLAPFDQVFGGLPRTGVATILGHPASGKSTLAITMAHGIARGGAGVRIFSTEQPPNRIAATALSFGTGLGVHGMLNKGKRPDGDEMMALKMQAESDGKLDLELVEEPLDARQIFTRCSQYPQAVRAVVVDYIQNLPALSGTKNETENIAESMRWVAEIPRRLGTMVIMVSQITAASAREQRAPRMTDGIGSSAIMQRSDVMLACYRPHQHEDKPQEVPGDFGRPAREWLERQQEMQLIMLKSKYSGRGMVNLRFNGASMRFEADSFHGDGYSLPKG
jgi:replicative DNA helicase